MNLYKLRLLVLLFIVPFGSLYAQVTYEFCMTAKYENKIVLDFKIHNNTTAPITDYNFVFDWKGVSKAIMYSGLDVIQNGDNGVIELRKTQWGSALPVGTTIYSITLVYETGMFPPDEGLLNGSVIKGIICYTPPAHENFKCERNFSDVCTVKPVGPGGHELQIGEGSAFAWNAPLQVYIPENRKSWAIAMALSHSLLTNLMGFEVMSINEYFATAIQETNGGCEGSKLVAPSWVTTTYPHHDTNSPLFCYDASGAVAVGYFQQEMGGSWAELNANYPCFIPQVDRKQFIATPDVGSSFEFQSIIKAYHDYRNVAYWQYVKCWNPIEFFKKSNDPYAAVKIIGMAYNQGMNHLSFEEVFSTDRTASMNATNLMDKISPTTPGATNRLYAEQINRLTKVLDNKVGDINWSDAAVFGVTDKAAHSFRGFYDAQFTWNDVEDYIKKIMPFYTTFGVNEADFIAAIKPVFDNINGGNSISFRYQMAEVVEAMVVYLPAFDPKKGLAEVYGGSGANGCFAPTARMEGRDAKCGEDLSLKVYFSGKAPYTFTYKRTDVSPEIVSPDITTSQNPYTITGLEEGTYALIAIRDDVSAGEVVCMPIEIKYIGVTATAKLSKYGSNPCSGIGAGVKVEIKSNEPGPYILEYEINGVSQTPITINTSPYNLVPAPAAEGTYRLTKISVSGCDSVLDEIIVIDAEPELPVINAKLTQYGGNACLGLDPGIQVEIDSDSDGPFVLEYEINGVLQSPVTIAKSPFVLIEAPAPIGTYSLKKISINGCDFPLDETLIIDKTSIVPELNAKWVKYGENACLGIGAGLQVEFTGNVAIPYVLEYELNGKLQPKITINSTPYILATTPAAIGTYHLVNVATPDCDFPLDETIVVDKENETPELNAKWVKYGENACLGIGAGLQIEFTGNVAVPYVLEYELNGVLQPKITINSSPYILATAPAAIGTYHLVNVATQDCDFPLDETIVIGNASTVPELNAKWVKDGENACLGVGAGLQIEFTGNVSAPYVLEYELNGKLQPKVTVNSSPYILAVAPAAIGTYHLVNVATPDCAFTLDETVVIDNPSEAPELKAKWVQYGENVCLGIGAGLQVEFTSNVSGPYILEYELNGKLQPKITINSSPYILATAPAAIGTYHLINMATQDCDFSMDETSVIDSNNEAPVVNAKLTKYGGVTCSGANLGVAVEIESNVSGPYILEYEFNGVLQPLVTVNSKSYVLIPEPAPEGTYRLTSISTGECNFSLNDALIIDKEATAPRANAEIVIRDGISCMTDTKLIVNIESNDSGPFVIEYDINGVVQPKVTTTNVLYTLITSPAAGTYTLRNISIRGCDFPLNSSVLVDEEAIPMISGKLVKYGGIPCLVDPGIRVEIVSNVKGTYVIEYEIDGIAQPRLMTNISPFTIIASPAPLGIYRLTNISFRHCEFPHDNTLIIDGTIVAPKVKIEGNLAICKGETTVLKTVLTPVDGVVTSYQWKRNNQNISGAFKATYTANQAGNYTVMVTDPTGCTSISPVAKVVFLSGEDCGEVIPPDPDPDPEPEPFEADYPKFFTPNQDGYNDTWHIKNFEKFNKPEIRIFDRYGKFITQLTQQTPGWDGTYNNNPLFATDYWFVMTYEEKNNPGERKLIRGHFSLKR